MKIVCAGAVVAWAAIAQIAAPAPLSGSEPPRPRRPVVLRLNQPATADAIARPAGTSVIPQVPQTVLLVDHDLNEVTVPFGAAEAHLSFQVINVSDRDVVIKSVQTSCGCTVAQLPALPWTLAPAESGPVSVTMNVMGRSDFVAKTVTLWTDRGVKTLIARVRILPAALAPKR